ncbi:MAG: hypothetical protein E6Q97_30035 [Desulfurellales bacterium]|nr:MAG: hypothetical protein E6Q97_30035 [Desulfurellales bacterium]
MQSIPVFYDGRMVADSRGYSPSAAKPKQVVEDWQAHSLPIEIRQFEPATGSNLSRVHSKRFVTNVLRGIERNGHGNKIVEIAESCRYTCGSLLAAAQHAVEFGSVACSPSSGFHHAGYDSAAGFCTFNGIALAASLILQSDRLPCETVLLLDGDAHDPDGVREIRDRFEVLRSGLQIIAMSDYNDEPNGQGFRQFVSDSIAAIELFPANSLVIYQAGADAHIDDPLHAGSMTTEELRERDMWIFTAAQCSKIPLVWNLAGGYQRDHDGSIPRVLEIHRNTMSACCEVYCPQHAEKGV